MPFQEKRDCFYESNWISDDSIVAKETNEKNIVLMEIEKNMNLLKAKSKDIENSFRLITIQKKEMDELMRKINKQHQRIKQTPKEE